MKRVNNKGKLMYKCRDCEKRTFLRTVFLNRRNGNICMNCGGRLEPDSGTAHDKATNANEKHGTRNTGSFITRAH